MHVNSDYTLAKGEAFIEIDIPIDITIDSTNVIRIICIHLIKKISLCCALYRWRLNWKRFTSSYKLRSVVGRKRGNEDTLNSLCEKFSY